MDGRIDVGTNTLNDMGALVASEKKIGHGTADVPPPMV